MRIRNMGGPARAAGPYVSLPRLLAAAALTAAAWPHHASALDWIPPRPVTAVLPSAALAPGSTHTLELLVFASGAPASLDWSASSSGQFSLGVSPPSGSLVLPADTPLIVSLTVTLPDTVNGISVLTVKLDSSTGAGRLVEASAAIQAATSGRPEIEPVPGTWQAPAGTAGSVSFQVRSLIGSSEVIAYTTGRFNPDPNNQGALFSGSAAPPSATLPGGGTITVSVPTTIAANAYAGNLNAIQLSVTSNGGISNATGHAFASTPGSVPAALFPVGLAPLDNAAAGRDGPALLPSRAAWLVPAGPSGVRVIRETSTDSIGLVDSAADGSDDRWIGTIRVPAYAAALDVIPEFVTAYGETLDVGLLAAGRSGLMLLDLRVVEDPAFGTWEDFFDVDGNGIDDRILRTIPVSGFATDVAWFRTPSGRAVALVADADSGSVPTSSSYDPDAVVSGTGQGVVAMDVGAALDTLAHPPYLSGTLPTPGTALDLELRGGSSPELLIADGSSGIQMYGITASGGVPASLTFAFRGTVALSNAWGSPYARDIAWIPNTTDSVYAAVAASAGGIQLVRAPQGSGAPSLVLVQQTLGPAIGTGGTCTGTLAAALGSSGVALFRAPSGSFLNQVAPGAPSPYTAPVTLARGASWDATGAALDVAAHQSWMSGTSAVRFERTSGPNPDALVSDGERLLVLRPGSAAVTAAEPEGSPGETPPRELGWLKSVYPSPSRGRLRVRVQAPKDGTAIVELYSVTGRIVRTFRFEGLTFEVPSLEMDVSGLPSGAYFMRYRNVGGTSSWPKPVMIVR